MGEIKNSNFTFLNITVAIFFAAAPLESIALLEGFSIAKLSAFIILLGWITQGFKTKKSIMIRAFSALAVYATLSILWSIDKVNSSHQVFLFMWPCVIVSAAINYSIRYNRDIYLYLNAFLCGCIIATIATFIFRDATLAAAEYEGEERLTAFNQDQNTLAFLLCVGFTIVLDFFRRTNKLKWKYISLILAIIFVIIILSTGSRTGLILTVLVFGLYLLSLGNIKNFILTILVLLLFSPAIYNYIPESIWDRFSEINTLVGSGNFSDRGAIWSAGLKAFSEENFVLGVGYSNFSTMLREHFGWQMASHNTYLSYLVDLGMIGFIIFLYVLYRMFIIVYRINKSSKDIYIFAYIIPFFVVMLVLETEYKRWLFMFGVMLENYYRLNYASYNANHNIR